MDAITLLKNDHRKVEKIFSQIEKGTGNREQLFFPAVKNAKQTHDIVIESFEEHKQVKMVLADPAKADKKTEHWLAGLKVLMEDVQHHVGEEEEELFPKVKDKVLSEQELQELGTRMEAMKTRELAAAKKG